MLRQCMPVDSPLHPRPRPALPPLPSCRFVFRIGMPPAVRIELVSKMAAIEHRLAYGTSDKLQLGALCGAFAGRRWTRGAAGGGVGWMSVSVWVGGAMSS